ncbi:MAG: methyl-accepting chemotaxis protein [Rhizobacter sp.]|nr:methyl-accepting chemotaxis protein [Chlorobiales bacterium]
MANQFGNRLDRKVVLIVSVVLAVTFIGLSVILYFRQAQQFETELRDKAARVSSTLQGAWEFNAATLVRNHIEVTDTTSEIINIIHFNPRLVRIDTAKATNEDGTPVADQDATFEIKQTSILYRNPKNKPDEYEEEVLRVFESKLSEARLNRKDTRTNPDEIATWKETDVGARRVFRYMQPIYIKKQCLHCHGRRDEAPEYVRENYEGGYDYRVGDLRGAVSIIIPADSVKASLSGNLWFIIFLGLGAIAIAIAIIYFLMQQVIARPIQRIVSSARSVSQGNLTERVSYEADDEIGELADSFNMMVDNIKEAVRDIIELTMRLNQVAIDIGNTSTSVLKSAENQSVVVQDVLQTMGKMGTSISSVTDDVQGLTINVRETRTSIEDLIGTVQEAARGIQDANQVFSQVINEVQGGKFAIEQVNLAIGGISEKLESMVMQIQQLDKASREITNVADIINRTAKQTNLLAVNASIESAIAGDAGKGFKVVAEEIRNLATQSASASQQIQDMVIGIRQTVASSVDSVAEATQTARDSISVVRDADKTLEKITQFYSRSSAIMSRLSGLVDTQMRSSQQVTMKTTDMTIRTGQVMEQAEIQKNAGLRVLKTVEGLSETAMKNKEASLEISQLTQELINQAEQLQDAIRRFKLNDSQRLFK